MSNVWRLYRLENPPRNDVYEVKLFKNDSYLDNSVDVLMEYCDGEWLMREPMFINDYHVHSWRER